MKVDRTQFPNSSIFIDPRVLVHAKIVHLKLIVRCQLYFINVEPSAGHPGGLRECSNQMTPASVPEKWLATERIYKQHSEPATDSDRTKYIE
jgi:hypothetical protein